MYDLEMMSGLSEFNEVVDIKAVKSLTPNRGIMSNKKGLTQN